LEDAYKTMPPDKGEQVFQNEVQHIGGDKGRDALVVLSQKDGTFYNRYYLAFDDAFYLFKFFTAETAPDDPAYVQRTSIVIRMALSMHFVRGPAFSDPDWLSNQDNVRKNNLAEVQSDLKSYFDKNGFYPTAGSWQMFGILLKSAGIGVTAVPS